MENEPILANHSDVGYARTHGDNTERGCFTIDFGGDHKVSVVVVVVIGGGGVSVVMIVWWWWLYEASEPSLPSLLSWRPTPNQRSNETGRNSTTLTSTSTSTLVRPPPSWLTKVL